MQRFYVLPLESPDGGVHTGPKYLAWRYNPAGIVATWSLMSYGRQFDALVLCLDISPTDDAALIANTDVFGFPEVLDNAISGADNLVMSAFFDALNIPTDWLTGSSTYLQFLRTMAGLFQFAQRYEGLSSGHALFESGRTLSSRYNDLSAAEKAWFDATVASFGYPAVSANPTFRQLAKQIGDLWGSSPFILGGVSF